tara:strand:+ start:852 stop:1175 length:324 start_codon:yes stop_codon:yes gene_type:complete
MARADIKGERRLSGGVLSQSQVKDGVLEKLSVDLDHNAVLAQNKLMREQGLVRKGNDMWWSLSFSEMQYEKITRKYPDLKSHDKEIQTRAWNRFMKSSESLPYRVME